MTDPSDQEEPVAIDCSGLDSAGISAAFHECEDGKSYELQNLKAEPSSFGCGISVPASIRIPGSVGDFSFLLNQETDWEVESNGGHCCGHSAASGRVLIKGTCGDFLAANATGGFVAVLGRGGDYCGFELDGGEVLVRSVVGNAAGSYMRDGVLVLANGAGEDLGKGMTGGAIYLRGKAKSVCDDVRVVRTKDAQAMRLSLLLARAGISGDVKEFKLYQARKQGS